MSIIGYNQTGQWMLKVCWKKGKCRHRSAQTPSEQSNQSEIKPGRHQICQVQSDSGQGQVVVLAFAVFKLTCH